MNSLVGGYHDLSYREGTSIFTCISSDGYAIEDVMVPCCLSTTLLCGRFLDLTGSVVGRRSTAPEFKLQPGYASGVFHLSLRLITFGSRSAHLTYHVHTQKP